jgi:hypothetical protein
MRISALLYLCVFTFCLTAIEKTTLLIKIPTRERPAQFFKNLDIFYQKLSYSIPYLFLITCDEDDVTMNNELVIKRLNTYPNLRYNFHKKTTKVEACNKDLDTVEFEIVLAAHDDMEPLVQNFDQVILKTMIEYFPDFDGVLNFCDGFVDGQCNTLPIMGKKYYDRFGYIYNPEYKALVCNVELTLVSKILKKEKIIDEVIIRHNHPAWQAGNFDNLYRKNEEFHHQDLVTFIKRREKNFFLTEQEISEPTPYLWSILICTIEGREDSFERLCNKLKIQIKNAGMEGQIEVLCCKDKKGESSVGNKRNRLLEQSNGLYVSFIDDDDDVADNFIDLIINKLKNRPDCVSLTGIITFNGINPKKFIHSIQYSSFFEEDNIYYRPPNHLNPIKRCFAAQFMFPEKNFGEDAEWALALSKAGLLKREEIIETPYYFYLYADK